MDSLISVIVPVYNVETYLNKCIDSIIGQSYPSLELILINDGSTDKSGEICDFYSGKDSRVVFIHKKNSGPSDSRNCGIMAAKGDYITFIDSDDWIKDSYLTNLFSLIHASSADISACYNIKLFNDSFKMETQPVKITELTNREALELLTGQLYPQLVTACGKLYKKNLFEEIVFPSGKLYEDDFTTYKLFYKAQKTVLSTEVMYYYRQRPGSIIGSGYKEQKAIDAIQAFEERATFLDEIKLDQARDNTYRALFSVYRKIIEGDCDRRDPEQVNRIMDGFKALRSQLRRGNYKPAFKIGYELYYLFPLPMKFLIELMKKIKSYCR